MTTATPPIRPRPEGWVDYSKFSDAFPEPTSVEDAVLRKEVLVCSLKEIQLQLGNKNRQLDGERQDAHAYHQWRQRAKGAVLVKEKQILLLNGYLRKQAGPAGIGTNRQTRRAIEILADLMPLVQRWCTGYCQGRGAGSIASREAALLRECETLVEFHAEALARGAERA